MIRRNKQDRERLISAIEEVEGQYNDSFLTIEQLADGLLEKGVTVQKTGQWGEVHMQKWIYAHCPICDTTHDIKTNYCPNCGSQMKSRKEVDS